MVLLATAEAFTSQAASDELKNAPRGALEDDIWSDVFGGQRASSAFFNQVYQQRLRVFKSSPILLANVDSWVSELQDPKQFMARYWSMMLDTNNALDVRDNSGKKVDLSHQSSSWQDYEDEFFANGMSAVIRREHMEMQQEPLELAIKDTLRTMGFATHAYISAGKAQALEPHVDP